MENNIIEAVKIRILKKTIPKLLTWASKWFSDEQDPITKLGGNWDKFFKYYQIEERVYNVSKEIVKHTECGNFRVIMKITFKIDGPYESIQ